MITRAQWGARAPKNTTAAHFFGIAVHWEGPHMGTPSHGECPGIVKGIQNFHMDKRGWSDIAYNALVCQHGEVYEGRGSRLRNAANGGGSVGGVDVNGAYAAVCYIGGEGDPFTDVGKAGINRAAQELGFAGGSWKVHSDLYPTACPGDTIRAWVRAGHSGGAPTPTPQEDPELFKPTDSSLTPRESSHLIAVHSGLLLGSAGTEPRRAAGVEQFPADGGRDQRIFVWFHAGNAVSLTAPDSSGKRFAIDVPNNDGQPGRLLQWWDFHGGVEQQFRPVWVGGKVVQFVHVSSALALDVANMSQSPAPVLLWTPHDGDNQRFFIAKTI